MLSSKSGLVIPIADVPHCVGDAGDGDAGALFEGTDGAALTSSFAIAFAFGRSSVAAFGAFGGALLVVVPFGVAFGGALPLGGGVAFAIALKEFSVASFGGGAWFFAFEVTFGGAFGAGCGLTFALGCTPFSTLARFKGWPSFGRQSW